MFFLRCLFGIGLYLFGASLSAAPLPWNNATQGQYVRCLATDADSRVWVGTEGDGVWTASLAEPGQRWTHYTVKEGLAEGNATALVCDSRGRVWVGHLNHGVSVFNGTSWKNYDDANGPLGSHVFALAVSPINGDVWIATEAGLTRFSQTSNAWTNYTRANGLPADQVQVLAFDKAGTLYAATQCDGIAIGTASDDYGTWRVVEGPQREVGGPRGSGLPNNLINTLLVAHDGSVYAATTAGLAGSRDGGLTWQFLSGEDYVTALAEDTAGHLWIGHRQQGVEVLDSATDQVVSIPDKPSLDFVSALLTASNGSMLIGGYGGGFLQTASPDTAAPTPLAASTEIPPLPASAAVPTVAELIARRAASPLALPSAPGTGIFLGDDWRTQGDWVGHYGRQYAVLCGMNAPNDHRFGVNTGYEVYDSLGPRYKDPPSTYRYIYKRATPDQRGLYSPRLGHRRISEWNDGSFDTTKYPLTYNGPDLWVTFKVPAGPHRASFYFFNKDGQSGPNRLRDYLLELKPGNLSITQADSAPDLARARVNQFWGSVYKQFQVQGPGTFHLKIGRCNSHATTLMGVFLDRLPQSSSQSPLEDPRPYLGLLYSSSPLGLRVEQIEPNSPAARGGIQPGDVLLQANHAPLLDQAALTIVLQSRHVGETLFLHVRWAGKIRDFVVVLQRRPLALDLRDSSQAIPLPLGGLRYDPPAAPEVSSSKVLSATATLWSAQRFDTKSGGSASTQTENRLLAYRAALAAQAPPTLLANWRWELDIWTNADRVNFDQVMAKAWKAQVTKTPEIADPRYDTVAKP